MLKAFATVQWTSIFKTCVILLCSRLFLRVFRKNKSSAWPADLLFSVLLGAGCLIFLSLSHASQDAIEVITALVLAYVIDDLVSHMWSRLRRRRGEPVPPITRQ
jgi:hypothetical protein